VLDALNLGLREVIRSSFLALSGRSPATEEEDHFLAAILAGKPFQSVLTEILSAHGGAARPVGDGSREAVEETVRHIYRLALRRSASAEEIDIWAGAVAMGSETTAGVVNAIADSAEARQLGTTSGLLSDLSDGDFVALLYQLVLRRGAMPDEVATWEQRLRGGNITREALVVALFNGVAGEALSKGEQANNDPTRSHILGSTRTVGIEDWAERMAEVAAGAATPAPKRDFPRFNIISKPGVLVSAIASLYNGKAYLSHFLDNITSQTIFSDYCELIIIDANSPQGEGDVIEKYVERFPNIIYHRAPNRVGIYEAWNMGVNMSRGKYITNTNLDDWRRQDSLELQAATLDNVAFADVVYQDFYYAFEFGLPFEQVAQAGFVSTLPVVSPYNLWRFNSPHNAPMWRRSLHDEVGLFDATYKSAGDYDFWLRCAAAGKLFFKINDPHVVYFVNPEGLSTRADTRGIEEAHRASRTHAKRILSADLLSAPEDFIQKLRALAGDNVMKGVEPNGLDWRYAATQNALREASIRTRKAGLAIAPQENRS